MACINAVYAARAMGVGLVTLCTGSRDALNMLARPPRQRLYGSLVGYARRVGLGAEHCRGGRHSLGVEPEPGNVVRRCSVGASSPGRGRRPPSGIVLDAANLLPSEELSRQAYVVAKATDLLGGDLILVHAKDVDEKGKVVPAGRGAVDLPNFVKRVRSTGYDGALVGHGFDEPDAPAVAVYLQSLISGIGQ